MSKQPGYTRNITQIIQAGGQLRRDMEHSFTIELPNQPGILYVFTKGGHPELVGRATAKGFFPRCKGCRCEHLLRWDDENYNQAQAALQRPGGPAFYNILCVDGSVQIAMPGERYDGRVTCLRKIIRSNES